MKLKHPVTGFVRDVTDDDRARTLQNRGYEKVDDDTPIGVATVVQPGKGREGVTVTERAEGERSMQIAETETGTTDPPEVEQTRKSRGSSKK